jgi:hypothetical protein
MTPLIAITLNVVLDLALLAGLAFAMRTAYGLVSAHAASDGLDTAQAELDSGRPQLPTMPSTARRSTRTLPLTHSQARDAAPPMARAKRVGG